MERWTQQMSRISPANKLAVVDGLNQVLRDMTPAGVARAMVNWRQPYPPDPAAFAAAGERCDAAEQFQLSQAAAGGQGVPARWHTLPTRSYHAMIALAEAGFVLRDLTWGDGKTVGARAWLAKYKEACRLDDLGALPPPPPAPVAALPHKRDQVAADRGCAAARAVLAGSIPIPPKPPGCK